MPKPTFTLTQQRRIQARQEEIQRAVDIGKLFGIQHPLQEESWIIDELVGMVEQINDALES